MAKGRTVARKIAEARRLLDEAERLQAKARALLAEAAGEQPEDAPEKWDPARVKARVAKGLVTDADRAWARAICRRKGIPTRSE